MKNNFVAIDLETAQSFTETNIFICQIGIVVVENGVITERISRYVRPPENKYNRACIKIHGITPAKTKNEPTFLELWPEIEKYFINTVLIAHNAFSFDEKVLWQNIDHYNINPKGINKFIDTLLLYEAPSRSLDALCYGFGFNCDNHHEALADAENCAKIYLKYLNREYPDNLLISEYISERPTKSKTNNWFRSQYEVDENKLAKVNLLSNDELQSLLSPSFFEGKRVINTGDLYSISRDKLKIAVIENNGKYTSSLSKSIDVVVLGDNPGPRKIETIIELQAQGHKVICIDENQLDIILKHIGYE